MIIIIVQDPNSSGYPLIAVENQEPIGDDVIPTHDDRILTPPTAPPTVGASVCGHYKVSHTIVS